MYKFRSLLTKEQVFTIPNFMGFFRLVLIPFIIWTYLRAEYLISAGLVALSALTDILDGFIARRFDMISDLGKVLDPICDKLTHGALMICLLTRYLFLWPLFGLLAFKELAMFALGSAAVRRRGAVQSAKWYGKLCTVVIESVMFVLILLPGLPLDAVRALAAVCAAVMLFSLTMYSIFWIGLIRGAGDAGDTNAKRSDEE